MSAKVQYIPVWKRDATGAERMQELAQVASEKPHEFKKVFVIYIEELPDGCTRTRTISAGCSMHEALGMLAEATHEVIEETRR